ncbi:LuxR C-terminal-related transcriptional regulator [Mesorhizobium sp. UC22_110]|uniref:LuxR C-terminal-related transcriptional regulator n=1 Tax=Mesorhizobium sp. UC22_110 TaxID=3374552 RepID=UPI0037565D16
MHQTELYFRAGSRIVAGASLLRSERNGPFTSDNLTFLDRLVGFVEDSVLSDEDEASALDIPGLTPREREIANLVGAAMCNKDICRRLDIELPTVKTHISRILRQGRRAQPRRADEEAARPRLTRRRTSV